MEVIRDLAETDEWRSGGHIFVDTVRYDTTVLHKFVYNVANIVGGTVTRDPSTVVTSVAT